MGLEGHVLRCDWWISIHFVTFVGFCIGFFFFCSPSIVNVHIFRLMAAKNTTVGGDSDFRFRMLLKGAVTQKCFLLNILSRIQISD